MDTAEVPGGGAAKRRSTPWTPRVSDTVSAAVRAAARGGGLSGRDRAHALRTCATGASLWHKRTVRRVAGGAETPAGGILPGCSGPG